MNKKKKKMKAYKHHLKSDAEKNGNTMDAEDAYSKKPPKNKDERGNKMGRPSHKETSGIEYNKRITLDISSQMHSDLKVMAAREGKVMSDIIRPLIANYLDAD